MKDLVAVLNVEQVFINQTQTAQEVTYRFPLTASAAVISFIATVDGKRIVSQLKEMSKAKEEYDDALAAGHGAFLAEQG